MGTQGSKNSANDIAKAATELLEDPLLVSEPLNGGDLSEVVRVQLRSGKVVVAKSGPYPDREGCMLRRMADAGHSTYVHCKAGRARSATIVMCWLIERHAMSPQDAQKVLVDIRPHVNPALHQREVVQDFYDRHQESRPSDT